jgi:hypothetical protein
MKIWDTTQKIYDNWLQFPCRTHSKTQFNTVKWHRPDWHSDDTTQKPFCSLDERRFRTGSKRRVFARRSDSRTLQISGTVGKLWLSLFSPRAQSGSSCPGCNARPNNPVLKICSTNKMTKNSLEHSLLRSSTYNLKSFKLLRNLDSPIFINSRMSRVLRPLLVCFLKFMNTKTSIHNHHLLITIYIHLYSLSLSTCNKKLSIHLSLHFLFHPYIKYITMHRLLSFTIKPHFQKTK